MHHLVASSFELTPTLGLEDVPSPPSEGCGTCKAPVFFASRQALRSNSRFRRSVPPASRKTALGQRSSAVAVLVAAASVKVIAARESNESTLRRVARLFQPTASWS